MLMLNGVFLLNNSALNFHNSDKYLKPQPVLRSETSRAYSLENANYSTTTDLCRNKQRYHCREWQNSMSVYGYHVVIFV